MSLVPPDSLATAWQFAQPLIPDKTAATEEEIREAAATVGSIMRTTFRSSLTDEEIRRFIESMVVVQQPGARVLDAPSRPDPWLDRAIAERGQPLWDRYTRMLSDEYPVSVLRRLDETTHSILERLRDPSTPGRWRSNGLVVGEVQSGKTQNFIGLSCRAADMGYDFIVVLAGMQNSLRSQTQLRLDAGFVGRDSSYFNRRDKADSPKLGVGLIQDAQTMSFTTSREEGDFRKGFAEQLNVHVEGVPIIVVVKKNVTILKNLTSWVATRYGFRDPDGVDQGSGPDDRWSVRDRILLVIDDEADQASIDTAKEDPDVDPTKINQQIRLLLKTFERAAYVGYTATPYANLYIDHNANHLVYGSDLFPKDFIVSMRAPDNHFGPLRVFGLTDGDDSVQPLPIFRSVKDADRWLPPKHKKDWQPPDPLPESVTEAIRSFVLACAIREVRGQTNTHNSMLIHGTRFQDVQTKVRDQVADFHHTMKSVARIQANRPHASFWQRFRDLWESDHVPTTESFAKQGMDYRQSDWEAVRQRLPAVLDRVKIKTINGSSDDALDYYDHRHTGLYAVAIGGDKLSRGLTLDGLTVSYYLRTSDMYDTLLQMGRWFGYRPGYEDLCRLYTTKALRDSYVEITAATEELRRDLEQMPPSATPLDFGLGVQSSATGLLVTARAKMRRADTVKLTFSGKGPESTVFRVTDGVLLANVAAVEDLVDQLRLRGIDCNLREREVKDHAIWRAVPSDLVARFLNAYEFDSLSQRVRPDLIARYIERCRLAGELPTMTVALASADSEEPTFSLAGITIRPVRRASLDRPDGQPLTRYRIRRVLSPVHEMLDLDPGQQKEVFRQSANPKSEDDGAPAGRRVDGRLLRKLRRPNQALLIIYPLQPEEGVLLPENTRVIGYKLSFPLSQQVVDVPDMVVNRIWQEFGGELDDDAEGVAP